MPFNVSPKTHIRLPVTPLQLLAQSLLAFERANLPAIAQHFSVYLLPLEDSSLPSGQQTDAALAEATQLVSVVKSQDWRAFAEQRLRMCVLRAREEDEEARRRGRVGWGCVGLLGEDVEREGRGQMG